jgi:hypothetical protein
MTPLCVTKAAGDGCFGRLAPLPAPKFRGERSNGETDGLLRTESVTLARLRIDKEESDAILGDEEEAVDVSPGGHITKRLARSRPVSQELIDSTATTTGSRVSHNSCHVEAFFSLCFALLNYGLVTNSHAHCHKGKAQVNHLQRCLSHNTLPYFIHVLIVYGIPQDPTTHNAF